MKLKKMLGISMAASMALTNVMGVSAASLKYDLFNADYYADRYADVKEAYGDDADAMWEHYITTGITEGRSMNELLDVVKYREKYTDLAESFGDDWDAYVEHYLSYGAREGRDSGTDLNILDYAARNADLQEVFGDDAAGLWNHYQTDGAAEGRGSKYAKTVFANQETVQQPQETQKPAEQQPVQQESRQPAQTTGSKAHTEIVNDGGRDPEGETYLYKIEEYDDAGYLVKVTYQYDETTSSWDEYEYDDAGNMVKRISYDDRGNFYQSFSYEYDNAGKKVKEIWYDEYGIRGEYIYDGEGNMIVI